MTTKSNCKSTSAGSGFVYSGSGIVKVPGLDPVKLNFVYARDRLTAKGTTGFQLHGFTGIVKLEYDDGTVSGEGKLSGKKGRANLEDATVRYNGKTGRFSGSGALSYEINPGLIAKAGVDIPEKGPIKVKGELAFTKPIKLFDPFGDTRTLFKSPTIKIPIPGASIGPIGLVLTIDGSIVADYHIGPGELRDTKVAASFEPFEENKDLSVDLQSTLAIPTRPGSAARSRPHCQSMRLSPACPAASLSPRRSIWTAGCSPHSPPITTRTISPPRPSRRSPQRSSWAWPLTPR